MYDELCRTQLKPKLVAFIEARYAFLDGKLDRKGF